MLSIRPATVNDVPLLRTMILEFAEYERQRHLVRTTEQDLLRDGFGPNPKFRAVVAEWNSQAAGYALFFGFYSTWEGRPGIFLEDVYVRSEFRSHGIGKALFAYVAKIARQEGCFGLRWEVLDWNQPAIEFYKHLGAMFMDNWKSVMICEDAFQRLADAAP